MNIEVQSVKFSHLIRFSHKEHRTHCSLLRRLFWHMATPEQQSSVAVLRLLCDFLSLKHDVLYLSK